MKRQRVPASRICLFLASLLVLAWQPAQAIATTADSICSPLADPCEVLDKFTVTNLSVLDFGTRTVIIRQGGRLDVGPGQMTIRAGKLSVDPGASLRAQPNGTINLVVDGKGVNDGAVIIDGKVMVDGASGSFAGNLDVQATGNVELRANSEIDASGKNAATDGGAVAIQTQADIVVDGVSIGASLHAKGGADAAGGTIDLVAGGNVEVLEKLSVNGGSLDGGEVSIEALGDITISNPVTADGSNGLGFGGIITISADGNVTIDANVKAEGAPGTVEFGSGDGGDLSVFAGKTLLLNGQILAEGGADGDGGAIDLQAQGDLVVFQDVSTDGRGSEAAGGDLSIDGKDVTINGKVSSNGGRGGGGFIDLVSYDDIDIEAIVSANGGGGGLNESGDGGELFIAGGDDVIINANVMARGSGLDGFGGLIDVTAGDLSAGGSIMHIGGVVKASGNTGGGGFGGLVDFLGCGVEQGAGASMEAKGATGLVTLASRDHMTLGGLIEVDGSTGTITLTYRAGSSPPNLLPTAVLIPFDPVVDQVASALLTACPVCGNSVIEGLEDCDDGGEIGGDGCSENCRFECGNLRPDLGEDCDDGNTSSGDCCSPACLFEPLGGTCQTDGNGCTIDQCNGAGRCVHLNDDGAACDDGLFCNGSDSCQAGSCVQHLGNPCPQTECNTCGETLNSCFDFVGTGCANDGNECTIDECDGGGSCLHLPAPAGTACSDDGDVCTNDQCDGAGSCHHPLKPDNTPCTDDGLFCTGPETCQSGSCVSSGNPCPGTECNNCQEGKDSCFDQPGIPCTDDGNICTADLCDGAGTCAHPNNSDPCDDGVFCNGADTCSGGSCGAHSGDPCLGGAECNLSCNEGSNDCFDPVGSPCTNDGNICTNDECNGAGSCVHPANSAPCDDGVFCNGTDSCSAGGCVHAGNPCPETECNSCQEGTDSCFDPAGVACTDDGNVCSSDQCDGTGSCAHLLRPDNTPCTDDGLFCTGAETCQGGSCVSSGDPCPGTGCNSCQEGTDSCTDPPGTSCDDGDLCTPTDQCDGSGLCAGSGTTCGNGLLEASCGEECDDGNTLPGDGCDAECVAEICGNGKPQAGEECDDGNTAPGDGCSPACLQDVPTPLVPGGGGSKKDCGMAWALDPVPPSVKGFPTEKVGCRENDPACDFDNDRFQCTFHVWMCLNESIPGKPCSPPEVIESFELKKPRPHRPKDSADQANAALLEGSMIDLGVDVVRKKTVIFDGPGVTAQDVCTRRLDVVVPIRSGRPNGKRSVKVIVVGTGGGKRLKDADKLKLTCFR